MAPLLQKANLIFGMGMLEMGVTFSFQQMILDSAIIEDIRQMMNLAKLPERINDASYIADLVAIYKGEKQARPRSFDRSFWQEAENGVEIGARANEIVDEILSTHRVEPLDCPTKNAIRNIVLSAE